MQAPSNAPRDFENYNCNPNGIGDHLDAFYRFDDAGNSSYDGKYDRVPNFFALPPFGDLHTLSDNAVKQAPSDTLPEYKQAHGLPLHTLYLKEFTPVIAFRGDTGIRRDMPAPKTKLRQGRYVFGMTGWYRAGYFYLIMTTLLSSDIPDSCVPSRPTHAGEGIALFRIRADTVGTLGFRGLWLDGTKRPQVEIYRSSTLGGPKSFFPLPFPEKIVYGSFVRQAPALLLVSRLSSRSLRGR